MSSIKTDNFTAEIDREGNVHVYNFNFVEDGTQEFAFSFTDEEVSDENWSC